MNSQPWSLTSWRSWTPRSCRECIWSATRWQASSLRRSPPAGPDAYARWCTWMESPTPRPLMLCCRRIRLAPHQQLAPSGRKSVVGGTDTPSISRAWWRPRCRSVRSRDDTLASRRMRPSRSVSEPTSTGDGRRSHEGAVVGHISTGSAARESHYLSGCQSLLLSRPQRRCAGRDEEVLQHTPVTHVRGNFIAAHQCSDTVAREAPREHGDRPRHAARTL